MKIYYNGQTPIIHDEFTIAFSRNEIKLYEKINHTSFKPYCSQNKEVSCHSSKFDTSVFVTFFLSVL